MQLKLTDDPQRFLQTKQAAGESGAHSAWPRKHTETCQKKNNTFDTSILLLDHPNGIKETSRSIHGCVLER